MEERIREVLSRHDVRQITLEISEHFGNLSLVVASPRSQLRFVRDRGQNTCEFRTDAAHWADDRLSAVPPYSEISDFCNFVDAVLTAKNL